MFEEQTPPNKPVPVEDIFAQAQPPTGVARQPIEPLPSVANYPVTGMPASAGEPHRRGWLIWLILTVVILLLAAGGWYFWSNRVVDTPELGTNIEQPTSTSGEPANIPETALQATPTAELDSDGDGLADAEELELGINHLSPETDGDGLFDGEEVRIYGTDPLLFDSDGDGYGDGEEIRSGYNPLGPGRLLELPTAE